MAVGSSNPTQPPCLDQPRDTGPLINQTTALSEPPEPSNYTALPRSPLIPMLQASQTSQAYQSSLLSPADLRKRNARAKHLNTRRARHRDRCGSSVHHRMLEREREKRKLLRHQNTLKAHAFMHRTDGTSQRREQRSGALRSARRWWWLPYARPSPSPGAPPLPMRAPRDPPRRRRRQRRRPKGRLSH